MSYVVTIIHTCPLLADIRLVALVKVGYSFLWQLLVAYGNYSRYTRIYIMHIYSKLHDIAMCFSVGKVFVDTYYTILYCRKVTKTSHILIRIFQYFVLIAKFFSLFYFVFFLFCELLRFLLVYSSDVKLQIQCYEVLFTFVTLRRKCP